MNTILKPTGLNNPPYFYGFFGNRNIRYLKEDASGNIWFVEDKNLGVIDFSWKVPKIIYFPELNGKMVSGMGKCLSL